MANDVELAWAAGIVDGEGCISIERTRQKGNYFVRLTIVNTDPRMLLKIQEISGLGQIKPKAPKRGERQASYTWRISGRIASNFVAEVLPFLVSKRDEALVALQLQDSITANNRQRITEIELGRRVELHSQAQVLKRNKPALTVVAA